jgi:hypothetical protein
VWVNNGYYAGVKRYRDDLKEAEDPSLRTCFHDGKELRDTVRRWHTTVRRTKRISDNTTIGVLEHIEEFMLLEDGIKRPDAIHSWKWAEKLLQEQQSNETAVMSHNSNGVPNHPIAPPAPPVPSSSPHSPLANRAAPPELQNGVQDITFSDLEMASINYPRTHKYIEEQNQILDKCKKVSSFLALRLDSTNLARVSFILFKAEKSLRESDPQSVWHDFDGASRAVDTIVDTFRDKPKLEKPSQMLLGLIYELYLKSRTGLVKCELAIINNPLQPLPSESKKRHRKKAEKYAEEALMAQKNIKPGSTTCEAKELLKGIR